MVAMYEYKKVEVDAKLILAMKSNKELTTEEVTAVALQVEMGLNNLGFLKLTEPEVTVHLRVHIAGQAPVDVTGENKGVTEQKGDTES